MSSPIFWFQHFFLVATIIISFLALNNRAVINRWILSIRYLNAGQLYRLVSSGFVHDDYVHLGFNMFTYYAFAYLWAMIYSDYFGLPWWLFGVFYSSSILVVNVVVWIINRRNFLYASLGASGGVSAIVFSCILFFPWERLYVFFIPMPAIIFAFLYLGYSTYRSIKISKIDRINHAAHLVGSIYGIVFSMVIEPNILSFFWHNLLTFDF